MRSIRICAIFLFLVSCAGLRPAATPPPEFTLVRCGKFLDGATDRAQAGVDLLVKGDRIVEIGKGLNLPPGASEIDLREFTVLPGLIDLHVHFGLIPEDNADLEAAAKLSDEALLLRARGIALTTLKAGFTSVRDLGAYQAGLVMRLRDEIRAGAALGPRVQAAPFYLTIPHGGGDVAAVNPKIEYPPHLRAGVARGADAFRARATAGIKCGADVLKVIASGAVLAAHGTPGAVEMTEAEIAAVVEAAKFAGLRVAAHAHGARSIKDAIRAGAHTIEHASLIDREGLRLAKARGVALVMDIYNGDYIDREGRRQEWPEAFLRKNREVTDVQRRNFRRAHRAGVSLPFGSDAGVFPHGENARQLAVMVKYGMTPAEAIRAATSEAARAMGWEREVGSLRPGWKADLIAVRGDPLKDIRALERVEVVIQGGKRIP